MRISDRDESDQANKPVPAGLGFLPKLISLYLPHTPLPSPGLQFSSAITVSFHVYSLSLALSSHFFFPLQQKSRAVLSIYCRSSIGCLTKASYWKAKTSALIFSLAISESLNRNQSQLGFSLGRLKTQTEICTGFYSHS